MRPLKLGDICLTINTVHHALNDGLLVVVAGINTARPNKDIYSVERVDGQPFPSAYGNDGKGIPFFFKAQRVWARRPKLQPVDEQPEQVVVVEREVEAG